MASQPPVGGIDYEQLSKLIEELKGILPGVRSACEKLIEELKESLPRRLGLTPDEAKSYLWLCYHAVRYHKTSIEQLLYLGDISNHCTHCQVHWIAKNHDLLEFFPKWTAICKNPDSEQHYAMCTLFGELIEHLKKTAPPIDDLSGLWAS
jgi:hypothetical protein